MIGVHVAKQENNEEWILMRCMYCDKEYPEDQMTLEHCIPQFLGGDYVDNCFKVKASCAKCNNNLGLFVDAAFRYNHIINLWRVMNTMDFFDPASNRGVELLCMGILNEDLPGKQEEEVCEWYVGPLGESVFWIRPQADRFSTYAGGASFMQRRRLESVAYFIASERTPQNPDVTWNSFRDAFSDYKKIKKYLYLFSMVGTWKILVFLNQTT